MIKTSLLLTLSLASTLALANQEMNHEHMGHGKMQHDDMMHGTMKHGEMQHSEMDHSKMGHSMMNMPGMSAVGMPAKGAKADKVVHVILSDDQPIKFKKPVDIEPNDVVQFVVMNTGSQAHEFAIGSAKELAQHRKMMAKMAGMEHDTNSSVIVQPKKARQFTWHFHGDDQVVIDCNIDGHHQHDHAMQLSL
ncbi:copper-resistant cuproprotein CopI [Vibrio taketomensis]|uniref:copper-resistant cuproprotein CopI n=1 Tax=Vibrio taketomensis TaxID=2572923 RepID=UPI001389D96C|nr:copper-binding protein [Vibrio taketomensis]